MTRWVLPLILLVEVVGFGLLGAPRGASARGLAVYMAGSFTDLLVQSTPLLLLAAGMTLAIATAGIDLSVASQVALVAAVMSLWPEGGAFWLTAVPLGLLVGFALGTTNGLLIARLDVPPIIATLGTMILYRGLCFAVLGDAENAPFLDVPGYEWLGTLPGSLALLAPVAAGGLWFSHSRWRRELLTLGGNRVAARYAAIPVGRRLVEVYALLGLFTALAAIAFTARNGSVSGSSFTGAELKVIVAVVLGGTRVQGGFASLTGALWGTLVFAALDEGLRGASAWGDQHLPFKLSHLQYVLLGALLVAGVWLNGRAKVSCRDGM